MATHLEHHQSYKFLSLKFKLLKLFKSPRRPTSPRNFLKSLELSFRRQLIPSSLWKTIFLHFHFSTTLTTSLVFSIPFYVRFFRFSQASLRGVFLITETFLFGLACDGKIFRKYVASDFRGIFDFAVSLHFFAGFSFTPDILQIYPDFLTSTKGLLILPFLLYFFTHTSLRNLRFAFSEREDEFI